MCYVIQCIPMSVNCRGVGDFRCFDTFEIHSFVTIHLLFCIVLSLMVGVCAGVVVYHVFAGPYRV